MNHRFHGPIQYQVFMPDFIEGGPADMTWWSPPDSKEKGEKIGQWFQSAGPPGSTFPVCQLLSELRRKSTLTSKAGVFMVIAEAARWLP